MGTNVVRKGANRAAHNAKTSKAAQRTPLPAKGAKPGVRDSVRIGRELAAEVKAGKVKGPSPRCVYCNKLVPATESRCQSCKTKVGDRTKPAANGRRDLNADAVTFGALVMQMRDEQKMSWLNIALALGQTGNTKTISVWADRMYRKHRDSLGADYEAPDEPVVRAVKTVTPGVLKAGFVGSLPWEEQDIDDDDIPKLLAGRAIVWRNSYSGKTEEASVAASKPIYAVKQGKEELVGYTRGPWISFNDEARCILNFISREAGFRAVYIDAILQMS